MRKRYNRVTWRVRHIRIDFTETQSQLAASTKHTMTKDEFIDGLVDFLDADGYEPRMPVASMKKLMHSPHSESESYIFLKTDEEGTRLKLVLDIRWSSHNPKEYGNYSAAERKTHYLDTVEVPDIGNERHLDISDVKTKFVDVVEQNSELFALIQVDDKFYNSYDEALNAIEDKVRGFDQEVQS